MFKTIHFTSKDTANIMKKDGWWSPIVYISMFMTLTLYLSYKGAKKWLMMNIKK